MGVLCERVHVSVPVRVSPAFSSVLFLLFGPIQHTLGKPWGVLRSSVRWQLP